MQVGEAWVGHPYYDVIDNSTDFEMKMRRLTKVKSCAYKIHVCTNPAHNLHILQCLKLFAH